MQTTELTEIDASLRAIVRRAYDLGRSDALKRVVNVLKEDCPQVEHLALEAPDEMPHQQERPERQERPEANGANDDSVTAPWWTRRVR